MTLVNNILITLITAAERGGLAELVWVCIRFIAKPDQVYI